MSKQAFKRVRRHLKLEVSREPLPAYAWPGGYPVCYVFRDGGACCPKCANKEIGLIDADIKDVQQGRPWHAQWALVGVEANYEQELYCDHCGERIESAYADPEMGSVEGER